MQSQHFGGGTTVSIEGYSVHFRLDHNSELLMEFHSFLSDSKVQHSSTVYNHMDKLLALLVDRNILKQHKGGRVLCMTDGCASQYRSATSVFWMIMNSKKYGVAIDRGICAAGHGKSIVDAINGVDKNTILRNLVRKVVEAHDSLKKDSKSLQVHSYNYASDEKYSCAADCKRILEQVRRKAAEDPGPKFAKKEEEKGCMGR